MALSEELERRYANIARRDGRARPRRPRRLREQYSGFEGAVTYLSGFQIVHRYAYVVVPVDAVPLIVFPTEARYVGEHGSASSSRSSTIARASTLRTGRVARGGGASASTASTTS